MPMRRRSRASQFLASAMSMASASVDRLNQSPARLAFLFDYDADGARRSGVSRRCDGAARAVVTALADELASAPRLDRERFARSRIR
jgi:hypothetical protein